MDDKPQPQTNGAVNGSNVPNGVNGHAATVAPRRSMTPKRRRGFLSWSLGALARLLTWYSIYTILFSCPDSLDACNETSPQICKPYFHAKQAVLPHVSPYYHTYAAPYVDLARPYYDTFDHKVITPGRSYAVKYGGPRLAQVKSYASARWEGSVHPQILEFQVLAKAQYDRAISPYVAQAVTTLAPYYDIARASALQTYDEFLVPAYTFAHPYAIQGYDATYDFTKYTVIPSTIWFWNETYTFTESVVWPHLRDVYILKVEPQLVRIGERLGRYKERRTKSALEDSEPIVLRSTFVKPTPSVAATALPTTKQATRAASRETIADNSRPDPKVVPKTKEEIRELAAKTVAEDLNLWEGKFSQVVKEGASEIEERVEDISTRMIKSHAQTTGMSLVSQLETTVHIELESLKGAILHILENGQNNSEKRDEKLAAAIRGAGLNIRNKAQNIRDWRQSYEQETEIAVTKAAEEHFSILEQTRDLALQKIGMKWAWMDGVTYKDWQKYHQLRDRFEEWTEDLKRLITTHPGLVRAQSAGTAIEDAGMGIAHEAAIELGRLKQVATWKAIAEDFSEDFDSGTMQLAAEAVEERIAAAAQATHSMAEAGGEKSTTSADAIDESRGEKIVVPPEYDSTSPTTMDAEETQSGPEIEDSEASGLPPNEGRATELTNSATDMSPQSSSAPDSKSSNDPDHTSVADPVVLPNSNPIDGSEQEPELIVKSSDLPIHSIGEEPTSTTVQLAPSGQLAMDDDVFSSDPIVPSAALNDENAYATAVSSQLDASTIVDPVLSEEVTASADPTVTLKHNAAGFVTSEFLAREEIATSINDATNSVVEASSEGTDSPTNSIEETVDPVNEL